ncbi:hypothetical protein Cadr_000021886 [Camelus dromedarius]|uniref:Uncharacterized protein n=1 Tax=Camelus dromedarius TaxID=9838 RepID=A0A5N4CT70_CAMDR|nr:hypothetical protein Cadr_000021886 [Camelus dromedarius]
MMPCFPPSALSQPLHTRLYPTPPSPQSAGTISLTRPHKWGDATEWSGGKVLLLFQRFHLPAALVSPSCSLASHGPALPASLQSFTPTIGESSSEKSKGCKPRAELPQTPRSLRRGGGDHSPGRGSIYPRLGGTEAGSAGRPGSLARPHILPRQRPARAKPSGSGERRQMVASNVHAESPDRLIQIFQIEEPRATPGTSGILECGASSSSDEPAGQALTPTRTHTNTLPRTPRMHTAPNARADARPRHTHTRTAITRTEPGGSRAGGRAGCGGGERAQRPKEPGTRGPPRRGRPQRRLAELQEPRSSLARHATHQLPRGPTQPQGLEGSRAPKGQCEGSRCPAGPGRAAGGPRSRAGRVGWAAQRRGPLRQASRAARAARWGRSHAPCSLQPAACRRKTPPHRPWAGGGGWEDRAHPVLAWLWFPHPSEGPRTVMRLVRGMWQVVESSLQQDCGLSIRRSGSAQGLI